MIRPWKSVAAALVLLLVANLVAGILRLPTLEDAVEPKPAQALSDFTPTGGLLQVGTNVPINGARASGANLGSWRATRASDNFYWRASSTTSGLDQRINIDGAVENNANKLIVTFEAGATNATLNRLYQICDWSSSTGVDTAADANCTGGGWRTMNIRKVGITSATETAYTWNLYDGYWNSATNVNQPLSTPLSNFIRSSDGRMTIRAFSTTSCTTCAHSIDYVRVDAIIDPIYSPAGLTTSTNSTVTNGYRETTNALFTGQSGSDNAYAQVAGTAGITADFYFTFRNIRTFPGANTIMMRAEYSCTATGINHRPKIWNYTNSAWEDLTVTSIACATADATNAFSKSNVNLADYISGGEMRIGWRGLANGTQGIRIDMIYAIVGSVNSDNTQCEISFGTGTASNCTNTRDMDTTLASPVTWQQTTESDSTNFGKDYYAFDNEPDLVANDHSASSNLWIPASVATNTRIVGIVYATRWRSNATTVTTQAQFKDFYGGNTGNTGGWTPFGTTNAATTYTYQDSVTNGYFTTSPDEHVDTELGRLNVRIRTTLTTATAAVTRDIDYVFASVRWTETTPTRYTLNARFVPEGGTLVTGTERPRNSATSSLANIGSWRGAITSDNFYWSVSSTASGLDQQLYMDNVKQNGANMMLVTLRNGANSATLTRLYQICDWSSTVGVDNAADAQCTGGGWRTMNNRKLTINTTADTVNLWRIYDGYWNSATNVNQPISTPISNFINTSNGRVLIRAFSTVNCTTCIHNIDLLRVEPMIDSIYYPAALTTSTASTVTNSYREAGNALIGAPTGSDNVYVQVAGTAGITSDFYFTFQNVKTYPAMNAIVVRAEYSCTATGINHRPKIWNFTNSAWEDLTSTSIACATGDATNAFAKNNVNVNDYISNGQMRVGWRGLANGTQGIRIDMIYLMLGSVNSDSSQCEISFGTGTATNCVNTRDLDTTLGSPVTWQQTTEADSANFGHDYYALDTEPDTTVNEHGASANVSMSASIGGPGQVVGRLYAANFRSNATTIRMQPELRDLSGANVTVSGGWTAFATFNNATTYSYMDVLTNGFFANNPEDYVDTYSGQVNMRFRTLLTTATTGVTRDIDFAFTGLQWVEPPVSGGGTITLTMDSGSVALGSVGAVTPVLATSSAVVDVAGLSSGYQILLDHDGVTSTLMHTDAVTSFPDYTDWNGSNNSTSTPGSTLAFRVSTSTANYNSSWWGSGTALFAGIPAAMTTIMTCASCNTGITTTSVSYRVLAPGTLKTGSYNGTSTFTALTNP